MGLNHDFADDVGVIRAGQAAIARNQQQGDLADRALLEQGLFGAASEARSRAR
jgi:hypothetical protein